MENAVDALTMAASVLFLIIALTVSISSFTSLKSQVDEILSTEEETDLAIVEVTNTDGSTSYEYLNYVEMAEETRTVTAETVISAIRRISRENYDIYIIGNSVSNISNVSSNFGDYYINDGSSIDLSSVYGSTSSPVLYLTLTDDGYKYITNDNVKLIYDAIKGKSFQEYIGIWRSGADVSDANKVTYRIITYVQV